MDAVDAGSCGDGVEDRHHDDGGRGGIHEHADDAHGKDHQEHQDVGVGGDAGQQSGHLLGELFNGQAVTECGGACHDEHGHAGGAGCAEDRLDGTLKGELLVDKDADDQTVSTGDCTGLGCGEHTGQDAANDDQRHDQRRQSIDEGLDHALEVELDLHIAVVLGRVLLCLDESVDHLADAHQNAGDHACHEQLTNGDTGDGAVQHHQDGRRNDGTDGCGCRSYGSGVVAVETGFVHGADQHAADGSNVGRGGAGNACKQHGCQNVDVCQTAGDKADQLVCKADDALGNAAGIHDLACKDEQRNCHQGKGVTASKDALGEDDQILTVQGQIQHGGDANTERNRHADEQHQKEDTNDHPHITCHLPCRLHLIFRCRPCPTGEAALQ